MVCVCMYEPVCLAGVTSKQLNTCNSRNLLPSQIDVVVIATYLAPSGSVGWHNLLRQTFMTPCMMILF